MNHDPEQILALLKPCPTTGQLRSKVLSAIDGQLRESRRWRLQKRIGLITLAMVIIGAGLNIWVDHNVSRRIAALFPPPTPSRDAVEIAAFVSKYTDPQAGQWVYRQLAVDQSYSFSPENYFAYIQKITAESEILFKDRFYEKSEKNSPLDGHKPGNIDRNPADMRGMLFLDSRLTA
ncbi:MAG: hypothetical protein ABSG67_03640 [Thermoguttaceae bacterium]|jgi:hypothetical protein